VCGIELISVNVSSQHRRLGIDLCEEGWMVLRKGDADYLGFREGASGSGTTIRCTACVRIYFTRDYLYRQARGLLMRRPSPIFIP
jgi:hypothetical protein